ncbi:MAG: class I SAM-dependent methyltransferase [Candidatus Levybacteria bacterium]|nr:class I SAM-dependent methyltransferase [Candidatus Levybacteria bacterium]
MGNMVSGLYFYNFDALMHEYMIRSFEPFFKKGNLLEVGSWKNVMTKKLMMRFSNVTCVDPEFEPEVKVKFYKTTIEKAQLPEKYDNIVMVHTLEHIKDAVLALKQVKEYLKGRAFIACPNANAPSRQIAVHMGLIDHNAAVTKDEIKHGHYRTYTLDTMERDIKKAGLKVVHRGGVFFKALANFQIDQLGKIVSPEYMEGCYQLGKKYPDLCSSIFFVCE